MVKAVAHSSPRPRRSSGWWLFAYRVPAGSSNNRVSVWRELKRLGVYYVQQCVCVAPRLPGMERAFTDVRERIATLGGSSMLFRIPRQSAEEEARLELGVQALSAAQYAKIVEECERTVLREIASEEARRRFTFTEAQEIDQNLDKVKRWYQRAQEADWCGAFGRDQVDAAIRKAERALAGFYAKVHARSGEDVATGPRRRRGRRHGR